MNAREGAKILKAALQTVTRGQGECGRVAVRGGQLIVTAERDNNGMIAVIDGFGPESTPGVDSGLVALDAQELGQWLKFIGPILKNGLGAGEITITPQGDKCALRIYDKEWPIAAQEVKIEEPPVPDPCSPTPDPCLGVEITTDAGTLAEKIGEVKGCIAGKDDNRPVLRWIHFVTRDERLGLEAANGFYMAQSRLTYQETGQVELDPDSAPGIDWSFGPLIEALLHFSEFHKVKVQIAGNVIVIAGEGFTVTVIAEGRFPDTEQIIPKKMIGAADSLLLDVGEILAKLPEAHMQTEYGPVKGTNGVLLYTDDGATLKVMGVIPDPRSLIPALLWGVYVNGKFLAKLLKGSGRDLLQIKWDYEHPNGPIVLADDGDWIGLIMPLLCGEEQPAGIARKEEASA